MTKLDIGKAWEEAMALLSANKDVVLIVAAVFFFLPSAISTLAMPQDSEWIAMLESGAQPEPEMMLAAMNAWFAEVWWIFLLVTFFQMVGVLGLLALLRHNGRPTVGEALGFGAKAFLPYLAAQIIASLVFVAAIFIVLFIGGLLGTVGLVIAVPIALAIGVYLWVKFSLVSPVIAIEKNFNPVGALQRSWKLTKRNSLRLFFLFFLLIVVLVVVYLLTGMISSLFALGGEQVGLFASAILGALVGMVFTTVFMAVLAAVHRQLSGDVAVGDTFD